MPAEHAPLPNFIIGGTEKAGTTSVFSYLSEHPQVCASSVKETNFFRGEYTGDPAADRERYGRYFPGCDSASVIMEASPAYLGCAALVAPRIAALIPDVRMLFILRNPIERLYSSYHFHLAKLNIRADISFRDYVDRCLAYDRGEADPGRLEIAGWYLDALRFGRYADFLRIYYEHLPRTAIKVMFFDRLMADEGAFMTELSAFLGIEPAFWASYVFNRSNTTFSSRSKLLHRAAMRLNCDAERVLRRRPRLKRFLVTCYKALNQAREGYDPMAASIRDELADYYDSSTRALARLIEGDVPSGWLAQTREGRGGSPRESATPAQPLHAPSVSSGGAGR